jgi:colanic acid biosynthesis glycosyl transferase WcaI
MEAMVEDTLDAGMAVHMIASRSSGVLPEVPEHLVNRDDFTHVLVARRSVAKHAFAKRYLSGVKYAWDCRKHIKKVVDCDLVYVQSSPTVLYNILLVRWYLRKVPIIYSIQDMFPGSAIASGVMRYRWMQRVFYRLQKIAYRMSDAITVISEDMKLKVVEQGIPEDKVYEIVNWFDDRTVREITWEENRFVRKYNLRRDCFYVQYAGTMGYVFDYEMVLAVAESLRDYKDIVFQMIGDGSQKKAFQQEAERRGLPNIVFYPLEPQEMVSDVYSACSVCLIPLKKGVIGNSVPSKAALVMACRRPIVNSVDPESRYFRMFNEQEIGLSAPNDDPEAVAAAILRLYRDGALRERLATNAYDFSRQYYSRSRNTQMLLDLFRTVVDQKRDGKKG